ncbi:MULTISPECIES: LysR family transcriptional regulator [Pseudomonas]|uniref:LysR family transcriptional regulator n=1 Tax=Pseudomonas quercus TaxID=2722792 RepID=A0ABX0YMF9_9PSED|nr:MULTISPECIES: LysR family transcriptional regulator [Pseudomonas]MBF7144729.1 LysR family transcriptional regulator [Pseudomonas sp. LY10J]NJP03266.1 LysR family transcriptional regulator [Pseudomonas quercus]
MKNALQSIRAFVTVAHAGHFAKAAAQLHLSPSALTVQVQQLEQWLGVALLDRGPRHLELTEAGRQNLPHMEQLLLDLDNLVASNRDLAALRRGTVELAALPSLCSSLLPVALKHFGHLHPGIEVRLRDVVAQQVEDQVRAGSVDFGLSVAPRSAAGLRFEPLLVDRICLLLPLDHPLNDGRPLTLAHLDAQPMILTGRDSSVRMQVERLFEDRHLRLHRQIEANYMSTAIALVQQGLGMTLLPESAVQGHETLACIPLEEPALNRCIGIITRSERALGPAAEALAELLSTHAAAVGA